MLATQNVELCLHQRRPAGLADVLRMRLRPGSRIGGRIALQRRSPLFGLHTALLVPLGLRLRLTQQQIDLVQLELEGRLFALEFVGQADQLIFDHHLRTCFALSPAQSSGILIQPCFMA